MGVFMLYVLVDIKASFVAYIGYTNSCSFEIFDLPLHYVKNKKKNPKHTKKPC